MPTSREPWLDGRTLTELDHVRLAALLRHRPKAAASAAALLADPADGSRRTLTICYPGDAEPDQGFISVLSPLAASLLGMSVGIFTT